MPEEPISLFGGGPPPLPRREDQPNTPPTPPADGPVQFDKAEFATADASGSCTMCQQRLAREYYQVNGAAICGTCRDQVATANQGTPVGRVVRALVAGTGAAIAGALLYFGISKATGYEFGLIAIVVGFAVGAAVRWGCYGRGGALYQTIAVALTYLAIVGTYIPPIIEGIRSSQSEAQPQQGGTSGELTTPVSANTPAAPEEPLSFGGFVIAVVMLLVIAAAAPFLAGFENIIGIIIIGIGVYEAWKINKRRVIAITGPHLVSNAAPGTTTAP